MNENRKTYSAKPAEVQAQRAWWVVDAADQPLGRLATAIAVKLRGKDKPIFTPHVDTGDFVVVVNAEKVKLTGNKLTDKKYYRHSGYPGGIREWNYGRLLNEKPALPIRKAVWGMLPKNTLGRKLIKKLKVYAGPDHPHTAQMPQPFSAAKD
jgi:large subunit ribosomal protein L13